MFNLTMMKFNPSLHLIIIKSPNPSILNNAGYSLIRDDDLETALKYFLLNVFLFKDNSNAYDSLGEAYMLNEQNELAIKYYQRSLELNPDNENAREMLKILNSSIIK